MIGDHRERPKDEGERMKVRIFDAHGDSNSASPFYVWYRATRFHYVPPSFLPAILCSMIAWYRGFEPDIIAFILVVLAVTINHIGLNLLDDVCDYHHAIDGVNSEERNAYTGGSGVLTEGLLKPSQVGGAAALCFAITAVIGLYLAWSHGWPVLAFGLFGVFCSVFYTLPPVKFGHRGLGEIAHLINFGPIIGLGAYYVQTGSLAAEPLFVSLILGSLMWSMIIINEIPDYDEDRSGGKINLVVRIGKRKAIFLYVGGLAAAYLVMVIAVYRGIAPFAIITGLAGIPFAVQSIMVLKDNYLHRARMMPANLAMIRVHLLTGVGMIAGYLIHFLHPGRLIFS
jgi:1,4-dihydroxy-2-naphthoate octaprenyltransferase